MKTKKKVLIFSPPFSGHLNVLKELVKDHNNTFDFKLVITGWTNIPPDLSGIPGEMVHRIEKKELHETDPALWTFSRAADLLDDCLQVTREFGPDLIIYDFFSLEGNFVGKLEKIPYWSSIPAMMGPFTNQEYRDKKFNDQINLNALAEIENKYGIEISGGEVEMVSDGFHLPGLINLVWSFSELTPSNLREGRSDKPYVFVGNPRGDNYEKTDFKNPKPLIYFSLGTVVMNNLWNQQEETRDRIKRLIDNLSKLWQNKNYQIIFVTQGKDVLSKYPDNWWVYDTVDQVEILSRADLFITHGGSNSFHEAVMQKVPMVVIPFFGDQVLVANRTTELGFGVRAGGSDDIDTHASKDFINEQLAIDLTSTVDQMLVSSKYAKKYLYLDLNAVSVKSLILGEIDTKESDIVIGGKQGGLSPALTTAFNYFLSGEEKSEKVAAKRLDFFATLTRVHVLLDESGNPPKEAAHFSDDPEYFNGGIQFYKKNYETWVPVDFSKLKRTKGFKKTDRPKLDLRNVVVTSESPIKIVSIERNLGKGIKVTGINPRLPHDEQLVGVDEIVLAAVDRLRAVEEMDVRADLYVSIVSGIVQNYHQVVDIGVVLLKDSVGNTAIARSAGLALPLNAVQKAKLRSYKKFTVGKILGEEMASHVYDTDPHSLITQGKQSRGELLSHAFVKALKHLRKD